MFTTNLSSGVTHSFFRTREACDSNARVLPSARVWHPSSGSASRKDHHYVIVRALLVVALLVFVASGCSDDSGESERLTSAFPGAGVDCPTEEPRPVTADLATEALAEGGFSVEFDEEACGLAEIAGMLSNSSNSTDDLENEGVVVCFLFVRPRDGAATPDVSGDTGGAHTERSLANLTCDLYANGVPAEEEFARLDLSFEKLRQRVG